LKALVLPLAIARRSISGGRYAACINFQQFHNSYIVVKTRCLFVIFVACIFVEASVAATAALHGLLRQPAQPDPRQRRRRALDACKGAQDPQTAPFGPDAAFPYAREHGLDMLMVSEHNHMYDGSDGTNSDADPAAAKALYQSGLRRRASFNAAQGLPGPVRHGVGRDQQRRPPEHLQQRRAAGLGKERQGRAAGRHRHPRNDYAALYTLMRQRGWIGQFNHPSLKDQFKVNGVPLAYTPTATRRWRCAK
jgi:hypothetical protein